MEVRGALDKYQTGCFIKIEFKAAVYEPVYQEHLTNLIALDEDGMEFISMLRAELWEDCRYVNPRYSYMISTLTISF